MDKFYKGMRVKPLISVIVPIFNVAEFLRECLESLQNQTYENVEILLIDDGSSDESGDICEKFASENAKFRVFHKKNGGQAVARNLGLDNAKGEYIAFLDSDDILESHFCEKAYEILKQNGVKMAMLGYKSFISKSEILNFKNTTQESVKIYNEDEIYAEIFSANPAFGTAVWRNLYHKSIWQNLRFPQGQIYEDVAIAYEIFSLAKSVAVSDFVGYFYRIRQGSTTNSFNEKHLKAVPSVRSFANKVATAFPHLKNAANFTIMDSMTHISRMIIKADETQKYHAEIAQFQGFLRQNFTLIFTQKSASKMTKILMLLLAISPNLLKFALKIYGVLK